jgi:hypothetical protein
MQESGRCTGWFVVPKVIQPQALNKTLKNSLKVLEGVGAKQANFAYRFAGIKLFTAIIVASPVDTGRFRASWLITTGTPASGTRAAGQGKKGEPYVLGKFPRGALEAGKIFLTNNLPYARTIEFGLYPNPTRGTPVKGSPGKFDKRSEGGFSTQASQGLVRVNALRFKRWLKRGVRLAPK